MLRPTGRGVGVLVATVGLFVLGQVAGFPFFLAIAGAGAGVLVSAVAVTGRRPRVAVAREVYPDRVERGRPAFARLRVHNPTGRRQAAFSAVDTIGPAGQAVRVRALPPNAEAVHHYELPTTRRGRHQVGPLTLDRGDPLGLGNRRLTTGETATLWVYPRVHVLRVPEGGRPRHHHEGAAVDERLRGSFDLREVREYVPGDEVRHLHWKATARTGQLMVRDYVDPDQPRFTTVLDTRLTGPLLEEAVDLAASLVAAAAGADQPVRLVTPGGLDVDTGGGTVASRRLLDALCEVAPSGGAALVPDELLRSGVGGLAVVTAGAGLADRAALAALRGRYSPVTVFVLGEAGPLAGIPGATVLPAADAAEAARRWNAITR
ncbi:DUF58 domain-containing protein [Amycolatopsis jiangsuensis]|uniref:Uncharacterized protein (DUF58 family) n=1 Tax=Amycolatopsis jiangsuensis TaxID=1181879 RepID=A0A840J4U5_9PSEU|nr:DUF58 domain-containing protein [Amycolatopsis jiangsuensis]MBB4688374.1 uncharacterized protein (DUF58 family) [Amycolatopsis jiangsuensis]